VTNPDTTINASPSIAHTTLVGTAAVVRVKASDSHSRQIIANRSDARVVAPAIIYSVGLSFILAIKLESISVDWPERSDHD